MSAKLAFTSQASVVASVVYSAGVLVGVASSEAVHGVLYAL